MAAGADFTELRFGAAYSPPARGDASWDFFNSLGGARGARTSSERTSLETPTFQASDEEERDEEERAEQQPQLDEPQQKKRKSRSFTGRMLRRFQKMLSKIAFDAR
jgi:hypothetical protein